MQDTIHQTGSGLENHTKELAPGGHQEQGESRVTEFRAPDSRKTSGAEVVKQQQPLSAKSISGDT